MRSDAAPRARADTADIVGTAAGSRAGASAGFAASQPAANPVVVDTQRVSISAVDNLGLNTAQAKNWQCWLRDTGYHPGTVDGQLGTNSWQAAHSKFNDLGFGAGTVDGIAGTSTITALQRYLNIFGYGLTVDETAGTQTKTAFADYNFTGC